MKLDVAYNELLPHPIEAVWSELTDAAAILDWLMAIDDFRPAVGCRFGMKRLSTTGWVEAEVLEIEPPYCTVWSWSHNDGNPPSTVTFELAPDNAGTRLRLRHMGEFEAAEAAGLRNGWPRRITALAEKLGRAKGDR